MIYDFSEYTVSELNALLVSVREEIAVWEKISGTSRTAKRRLEARFEHDKVCAMQTQILAALG